MDAKTHDSDTKTALPPGQREFSFLPRYGLFQYATRINPRPPALQLDIGGDIAQPLQLGAADLAALPRVAQCSDLHCITTWSKRGNQWSGYRFRDFYTQIVQPHAQPAEGLRYVVLHAQDRYRTYFELDDALADDVLLADRLDGVALDWQHGAPLRIVAPAHYGFRSAKHLVRIEFCRSLDNYRPPAMHWTEHPRARVAYEERGRWLPAVLYRYLFRAVVPLVLWWYRRAARHAGLGSTR